MPPPASRRVSAGPPWSGSSGGNRDRESRSSRRQSTVGSMDASVNTDSPERRDNASDAPVAAPERRADPAQPARSPFLAAAQRLETDERLDAIVTALSPPAQLLNSGRARPLLGGQWLGHALHPLLTDFPLGCWIGAGLLDLLPAKASRPAAQRLVGLGVIFTLPTAAAGLSDWATVTDRRARRVGAAHVLLNTAVAGSYLWSWSLRRRGRHRSGVAVAMVGASAAWVSGYLGGHMSLRQHVGSGDPSAHAADAAP
jgi:uncharacterized membrane protein